MPAFVAACPASDIAPGTGQQLTVGGKDVAVFNVDGTFYAVDNTCPHRGGPLA
jgi:nitrite reductase (NADH) small subunit/3-phenylpropionate/trans-cinnamate dioxygenase ferredoxin subunit